MTTMDKYIGVLGGMGTEATAYFYNRLVSLDDAKSDQEHLKVLLYNNSKIPDRTDYIINKVNNPVKELLDSVILLENAGVDFIVMPCNTSHYFYNELQRSINKQKLHKAGLDAWESYHHEQILLPNRRL